MPDGLASPNCSIARALEVVGAPWMLLILRDLGVYDVHRFDQLQRRLGIARNILAARLRALTEEGLIEARRYHEHPPRYEYHLTTKGRELGLVLSALMEWGDRWTRDGSPPPVRFEHTTCGTPLRLAHVCPACERTVGRDERRVHFERVSA